jgi:hypothetical protein
MEHASEFFHRHTHHIFKKIHNGMSANPAGMITENAIPNFLITGEYFSWYNPKV